MSQHHFNIKIAQLYSVEEAIFLNNLEFWTRHNQANHTNFHKGRYWTYNSREAYTKLFPYWSADQIKRIIQKCISNKLIEKDCFNKNPYDRTSWYSLTNEAILLLGMESNTFQSLVESTGRNRPIDWATQSASLGEIAQPIPYIKPDEKPIINTTPLPPKPEDPKKVEAVKKVTSLSLEDLKASNPHDIPDEHLLDWLSYRKKPITLLFWEEMNKTLSTLASKGIYPEEAFTAMLKNRWGGIEERYFEKDIEYKNKKRSAYKNTVESVMRA
jgi:hypothetical protein